MSPHFNTLGHPGLRSAAIRLERERVRRIDSIYIRIKAVEFNRGKQKMEHDDTKTRSFDRLCEFVRDTYRVAIKAKGEKEIVSVYVRGIHIHGIKMRLFIPK